MMDKEKKDKLRTLAIVTSGAGLALMVSPEKVSDNYIDANEHIDNSEREMLEIGMAMAGNWSLMDDNEKLQLLELSRDSFDVAKSMMDCEIAKLQGESTSN